VVADVRPIQRAGLLLGPALGVLILLLPPPSGLDPMGWRTAAVTVLMAVWWMTEAIPIPATALLPLALFPVLGILPMSAASAPYANPLIFLFLGGFLLALAMERWNLHRRIALGIMDQVGTGPRNLVLGFMVATAFLSMWISNTATAAMMFPLGVAVATLLRPTGVHPPAPLGTALMLGIAYGASIGGVATLIGTPPNAIFAAAAAEILGQPIGFLQWMTIGVPLALVFLPMAWILLVRVLHPLPARAMHGGDAIDDLLANERGALGPMGRGERSVAVIFCLTALAWIFREPKTVGTLRIPGLEDVVPGVSDAGIAILAGVILFVLPVRFRTGEFVLDWETGRRVPWGVLLLFGGGLSLARAMESSGLADWIGGGVLGLAALPPWVLIMGVATVFVLLTEVTSNTATATMAMPILAGIAAGLNVEPATLMATAALATSMAFMLPVATPPNAIVFASDDVTIPLMARAGLWMNLLSIGLVSVFGAWVVGRVLGQ
jgi:solute carrier family 13 (sodium-dependent dicarboxylate transporter), member 2/3/5